MTWEETIALGSLKPQHEQDNIKDNFTRECLPKLTTVLIL